MSKTRHLSRTWTVMLLCIWLSPTVGLFAGPKGTVASKALTGITIDGDFSDWPLTDYTKVAQQPLFPDARDSDSTNADGDHLVWELDRVGGFNGSDPLFYDPETPNEFGSAIYLGHDSDFLYILGVFIDDEPYGVRGEDGFSNFLNDGFEIFIDALGDSDDQADEIAFPSFDEEEPNFDDFQMTVGLNDNFPPDNPGPNDLGARQHMERAGSFEIIREGYEDILQTLNMPNIAARSYDDLRAAGARNPEILANPNETFSGYAVEVKVPFGIVEGFTPDHDMGFDLFWRDVDDPDFPDPGFGGAGIFWSDWAQNTTVASTPDGEGLFHTANWGTLTFEGVAAQLRAGDSDQDFDFDQIDLVQVQIAGKYLTGQATTWGEGDWDGAPGGSPGNPPAGDGLFNQRDIIAALAAGVYLTGPYAALSPNGVEGDGQTSIGYNATTGEVWVDAPAGTELTSVNIDSAAGVFTGDAAQNLGGSFDNDADNNIFKATFGSSFGTLSFGNVAAAGLSQEFVLGDLTVVGSLAGGGDLGAVDLIYVPEPSTVALMCLGFLLLVGSNSGPLLKHPRVC